MICKNKVVVLGAGLLGQEFEQHWFIMLSRRVFDALHPLWARLNPYSVIVNAIGVSDTRWCESQHNWRYVKQINGEFPGLLSAYCRNHGKIFVHVSTGCLYDITSEPNTEDGYIAAHCRYTLSKWIGEAGCNLNRDLIVRPRLFFNTAQNTKNLLYRMQAFDWFVAYCKDSMTSTRTLVEAIVALLAHRCVGIFNIAEKGVASMYEIASWLGMHESGQPVETTIAQVRREQGLYLVNNTMDISKLSKYYQPPRLRHRLTECWQEMHNARLIV